MPCGQDLIFFDLHCTLKSLLFINYLSSFNYHSCFYLNCFLKTLSFFMLSSISGFGGIIRFLWFSFKCHLPPSHLEAYPAITLELLNAFPFHVSPSLSPCDSCSFHNVLPHDFQISSPCIASDTW